MPVHIPDLNNLIHIYTTYKQKWLPTAPGVCSLATVCVHLDGWNAEHNSEYGTPYLATRPFLSFPFQMQVCISGLTGEGDQNWVLGNSQFCISVTAFILICNGLCYVLLCYVINMLLIIISIYIYKQYIYIYIYIGYIYTVYIHIQKLLLITYF